MPYATHGDIQIYYELHGSGDPVMLLTGLGGVGAAWGPQIELFASDYLTIVPDHRGTGRSSKPADGYTIEALAADMAETLRQVDVGPAHIVGSSTGGAFGQVMALDHPEVVRSLILASSWARPDNHFLHQFATRRRVLHEAGPAAYVETTALFLFSPRYMRDHYPEVQAWCARTAAATDRELMSARIDMITAHDTFDRLGSINVPTLVVVGAEDACTPPALSRELAERVVQAEYVELPGGHLLYREDPNAFFNAVREFIDHH